MKMWYGINDGEDAIYALLMIGGVVMIAYNLIAILRPLLTKGGNRHA